MAVSILEALQNANYNLAENGQLGLVIAKQQLHNAVTLLEKGYGIDELVEEIIDQHGSIENGPNKQ